MLKAILDVLTQRKRKESAEHRAVAEQRASETLERVKIIDAFSKQLYRNYTRERKTVGLKTNTPQEQP